MSNYPNPAKKARTELSTATASAGEILAALEQDTSGVEDVLDASATKKLFQQVEKKYEKNRELRIKYADEPEKFLDSESELNDAIQELHGVTAQPEFYPLLVKQGLVPLIVQLLGHENADIVAITCSLIQELTDTNAMYESDEGLEVLNAAFLEKNIFEHIGTTLRRLNEEDKDEADAVYNLLNSVEHILEDNIPAYDAVVTDNLFEWFLKRATKRSLFDANKNFASQLLSETLQNSDVAKEKLVDSVNGIDFILRALAVFKKANPDTKDEGEHMCNLFGALCAALMHIPNRKVFLDGEGPELMNLMLREKKLSRHYALQVLSHATAFPGGEENCNKFVEIYGLRSLFPLFMRSPQKTKKKDTAPDEHEEYVISIIEALLFQCTDDSKERIYQKFQEHQCEKIDRLLELFIQYKEKVERYSTILKRGLGDEMDDEQLRVELLNNGLYTWQRIGIVLADVCTKAATECLARANKLLKMKQKTTLDKFLCPYLEQWKVDFEESDEQKARIENLLSSLHFQANANI